MWRALKSGGYWALFALTGLGAACSESPRAPPPSLNTAGTPSFGGSVSSGGSDLVLPPFTLSNCGGPVPSAPLTRWSVVDLDRTLDMLFGPGTALASMVTDRGYERDLSHVFVQALRQVAGPRVRSVVADSDLFEVCTDDDVAPSCIAPWLRGWGEKLYRRPLTREQTEAYVAQFSSAQSELSPVEAARNVLVSMILSPYFVLRIELSDGTTGQLTPDELAARLSHFATRRAPDSELRARATSGELKDPSVLLSELHRLWDTPEGREARALQHLGWLGLDAQHLPSTLEPELRAAMLEQSKLFISDVLSNQGGTLLQLLSSSHQPVSPLLAEHYGLAAPPADGFVDLEASLSAGILSQSLFLSTYPRASQRGRALLEDLLCLQIPDHPALADFTLDAGATPRERLNNSVGGNPACTGCHALVDPTGFALEAFDEQGRLTGFDSSGSVPAALAAAPAAVANPNELGRVIATRNPGLTCVARHYLEYVLDRKLPNPDSTSSNSGPPPIPIIRENPEKKWVDCLLRDTGANDFDLNRAAEELVTSDAFSYLATLPRRVVAFDTSVAPLEHALQETSQFRGVFPDPVDQDTIERYIGALKLAQELDAADGSPGAGGETGTGGEAAGGAGAGGSP
jgi:hypothetical protein